MRPLVAQAHGRDRHGAAAAPGGELGHDADADPRDLMALAGMWFGQLLRTRLKPATFRLCFFLGLLALGAYLTAGAIR